MKIHFSGFNIRHRLFLDVFCHVLKCYELPDRYKFKVQWWNMGFVDSWYLQNQNIVVYKKDLKDWQINFDYIHSTKCFRNATFNDLKGTTNV